jgi:hypothetical protein
MSAMIPIIHKKHHQCRAKSHGADFYLTPQVTQSAYWVCYGTTASQVRKLLGPQSHLHESTNWQDDEMEDPCYQITVPEKHVREFVSKLSAHGSVALIEPSCELGDNRETLYVCICMVPRTATPDEKDDLL